jgi:molecular chaperone HtpG
VVPPGGVSPTLERVLRAHGKDPPPSQRILEVNPTHPLITALHTVADRDPSSAQVSEWIEVLYEQALLTEGTPIEDPQRFARRLTTLLQQAVTAAAQ